MLMMRRTVTFKPWSVVTVPFPFTDTKRNKKRPALILSTDTFYQYHDHLVLLMITNARNSSWISDVPIKNQDVTGLTAPSVIRFKFFTLDARLIIGTIGHLHPEDKMKVVENLTDVLSVAVPAK
jgi:hypothetical protein